MSTLVLRFRPLTVVILEAITKLWAMKSIQLGTSSLQEIQSPSSRLHKLKNQYWFIIFEVKIKSSVTKVTTLAAWTVRKGGMLFLAFSPELSCIP